MKVRIFGHIIVYHSDNEYERLLLRAAERTVAMTNTVGYENQGMDLNCVLLTPAFAKKRSAHEQVISRNRQNKQAVQTKLYKKEEDINQAEAFLVKFLTAIMLLFVIFLFV